MKKRYIGQSPSDSPSYFLTIYEMLVIFLYLLAIASFSRATSRTSPPAGAIIVKPSQTGTSTFSTISEAVAPLPDDSTSQNIFIYPGTYEEQILINRPGAVTVKKCLSERANKKQLYLL